MIQKACKGRQFAGKKYYISMQTELISPISPGFLYCIGAYICLQCSAVCVVACDADRDFVDSVETGTPES